MCMKSLLDIQQTIRELDNTIKNVQQSLVDVCDEIDELRNQKANKTVDYDEIAAMAKEIQLKKSPLARKSEDIKEKYIELILSSVNFENDEEHFIEKLVFVAALKDALNVETTIDVLHKRSYLVDKNFYECLVEELTSDNKQYLIVDMLIVANLKGQASSVILEYIADIASAFEMSEDDVKDAVLVAKLVLTQSFDNLKKDKSIKIFNYIHKFKHYFDKNIVNEFTEAFRVITVEHSHDPSYNFRWKVQQGSTVKAGELVAEAIPGFGIMTAKKTKKYYAKAEGSIYQFVLNKTDYGIISTPKDNKDSIKAWVKNITQK